MEKSLETESHIINKYIVCIRRDTQLMKTFFKFKNRIEHPRASMNMLMVGGFFLILPRASKGIALPGVIICYVMGILIVLMALFRHYLSISILKSNPGFKVNEEISYLFGNRKIRAEKAEGVENVGSYNEINRLWEDEEHFYVGVGDREVLVLPKGNFLEGSPEGFKEFILEKSGTQYRWVPARFGNILNDKLMRIQHKMTQMRMDDHED